MAANSAVSPAQSVILSMFHGMWQNRCLSILVGFKIPEIVCNSDEDSLSIDDIAAKLGCTTTTILYPIMRVLAQWGIGEELENKHFAKNEAMELLRTDKGPSLGHMMDYYSSDEYWAAMKVFPEAVRNNVPAFDLKHGMNTFQYMNEVDNIPYNKEKMLKGTSAHLVGSDERRREFAENYNCAMAMQTQIQTLPDIKGITNVYSVFPWSTCNKLMDIGGGTGVFLASILSLPGCESVQGILVDLPEVIADAQHNMYKLGVAEQRIVFKGHDCREPFPSDLQVDTVIMKHTLMIFDIDTAIKILRNCRSLLPKEGARLLIITTCVDEQPIGENGIQTGFKAVHMLIVTRNKFSTKREFTKYLTMLSDQSGYKLAHVYDTFSGGNTIFELRPVTNSF